MEVRTAIVSLGVLCLYLMWIDGRKNRKFALAMCSLFVLFVVFFVLSGRLGQGFNDLLLWKSGHVNTSWGTRLELWSLAYRGFLEKILFSWGIHAYEKVISAGLYFPSELGNLRHFHRDYFNILCGGGLIGFFSWLATVGMLFRQSKNDYASVSILLVALALGFSYRYWFRMQEFLFFFGCLWVLLYQTRERKFQYQRKDL